MIFYSFVYCETYKLLQIEEDIQAVAIISLSEFQSPHFILKVLSQNNFDTWSWLSNSIWKKEVIVLSTFHQDRDWAH